jgi:Peptidase inhibitor family I36
MTSEPFERRNMKNRFALAAAVLLATVGMSTPAEAAESDCLSARICLFTNAYYGGTVYQWTWGYIMTLPGDCLILSGGANNSASSIKNTTGTAGGGTMQFFDLAGGGANFARSAPFADNNLGDTSGIVGFNNNISSICIS